MSPLLLASAQESNLATMVPFLFILVMLVMVLVVFLACLPRPPQQVINPGDTVKAVALDLVHLPPEANVDPVITGRVLFVQGANAGELYIESDGNVFKCLREGAIVLVRSKGVHVS